MSSKLSTIKISSGITYVEGTTDITNSVTANYTDLDDLEIKYAANGPVKITLCGPFKCTTAGCNAATFKCNIQVDGVEKAASGWYSGSYTLEATSLGGSVVVMWVGVLSGVVTIKGGWKSGKGTMTQEGATTGARWLMVEEF